MRPQLLVSSSSVAASSLISRRFVHFFRRRPSLARIHLLPPPLFPATGPGLFLCLGSQACRGQRPRFAIKHNPSKTLLQTTIVTGRDPINLNGDLLWCFFAGRTYWASYSRAVKILNVNKHFFLLAHQALPYGVFFQDWPDSWVRSKRQPTPSARPTCLNLVPFPLVLPVY